MINKSQFNIVNSLYFALTTYIFLHGGNTNTFPISQRFIVRDDIDYWCTLLDMLHTKMMIYVLAP